jgi:hypothetical protein
MSPEAGIAGQPGAKTHEIPSTARPHRHPPDRGRGQDEGRHHHSRHRQGKAPGRLVQLDVKAGDRVLFGKWSGTEVKIDGEDLLIMKESDVMGVIEGASATKKKAA